MQHLKLLVTIHCGECETAIRLIMNRNFHLVSGNFSDLLPSDAVKELLGSGVWYHQTDNQVDLYSYQDLEPLIKTLVKQLVKSGFELWSWELYKDDTLVMDSNQPEHLEEPDVVLMFSRWLERRREEKRLRRHKKLCKKCQEHSGDTDAETVVEKVQEYRAIFYVGGMTCASCVGAVSDSIEEALGANLSKESPFSVNLVQHSATVVVPSKQLVNTIVNAVLDAGFECKVLEILPVKRSATTKITAAIGGITCSACANSIQSAVDELPFVYESAINTVTKSGVFVLDDSGNNIDTLKTAVEDCGFDFDILETTQINYATGKKQSRTINLSVLGMYCNHCPELIHKYLETYGESVVIVNSLTLKQPVIKFTYFPSPEVTVRNIVKDLNHLHPSNSSTGFLIDYTNEGIFSCEVAVPVSMEEHLKKLAKKEVLKIVIRLGIATAFAIPTFVFGIVAMLLLPSDHPFRIWVEEPLWTGNVSRGTWIMFILSTPVYFFAADVFHRKALLEIKSLWLHKNSMKKRLFKFGSMNMLMFLGTTIAYVTSIVLLILSSQQTSHMRAFHTSYFDSVVFLTFFLLIGRLLESISKSKTADAVSLLGDLKTNTATLVEKSGDNYINDLLIDVKYLEVGDYIRISNGESPPVDCVIVDNSTQFDESAITGESRPVHHEPGHQVFSGTINVGDSVIAKILSLESESLIDQILTTVREGQMKKAPIERVADTITGYFVPIIVMVGVADFALWLGLSYGGVLPDSYLDIDIGGWFIWSLQFAIAVFVIACPCGIGLAAPTALFVGSGIAAKNGILAKGGGVAFQDGANTKVICFDKTGTLTHGELEVTDYEFATDDEFLKLLGIQVARDLELGSKHPLAKAVKAFVETMKSSFSITNTKVPTVETVPGRGIKGEIVSDDPKWQLGTVVAGNETFFRDVLTENQQKTLQQWKSECKSVILVGLELPKKLLLMLGLRDQLREESRPIINYLQTKLKIECWMITGDNRETAQAIAKEIGIPESHIVAEVLPEEKQQKVAEIKRDNGVVAMVGDGINDAPALASADIGISLASGADLAMNTSDFILLNQQHPLSTLLTLFDLSKVVFRRVKFNFAWALVYNMIGVPIAAGVIYPYNNSRLDPVWASAAMAASSVSVVLSSLALNWYRPKKI